MPEIVRLPRKQLLEKVEEKVRSEILAMDDETVRKKLLRFEMNWVENLSNSRLSNHALAVTHSEFGLEY